CYEFTTTGWGCRHEIISDCQALYHGRWPQDECYSRRRILGEPEGNRHRAKHDLVEPSHRGRFRAAAEQSVIGHSPLRTRLLSLRPWSNQMTECLPPGCPPAPAPGKRSALP